jgi:hypothetical protein
MIIALIMVIMIYMLQLNFKLFFTLPILSNGINIIDLIGIFYFSYLIARIIETVVTNDKFVDFKILLSFIVILVLNSLNVMAAVVFLFILFYLINGYLQSHKILYFIVGLVISAVIMALQGYIIGLYNGFMPEYLLQYTGLFLLILVFLNNKLNSINEEFILLIFIILFGPTNILALSFIIIYYLIIAINVIKKYILV